MLNWLVNNNHEIPIPLIPPEHVNWSEFLVWVVTQMDQYRDIRLIWTVVEAFLMLIIGVLIIYFIYKVKAVEGCLKERYKALDEKVKLIAELHKKADQLEGKNGVGD
jgi:hypothetical protein